MSILTMLYNLFHRLQIASMSFALITHGCCFEGLSGGESQMEDCIASCQGSCTDLILIVARASHECLKIFRVIQHKVFNASNNASWVATSYADRRTDSVSFVTPKKFSSFSTAVAGLVVVFRRRFMDILFIVVEFL